jgi:hypothetical protein
MGRMANGMSGMMGGMMGWMGGMMAIWTLVGVSLLLVLVLLAIWLFQRVRRGAGSGA